MEEPGRLVYSGSQLTLITALLTCVFRYIQLFFFVVVFFNQAVRVYFYFKDLL